MIEVDIEDESTAKNMGELFGISEGCWGHANVNLNIHPDVNISEVRVSKRQVKMLKGAQDDEEFNKEERDSDDNHIYEKNEELGKIYGVFR